MRVALGADHAGFLLKEAVKEALEEDGYEFIDLGTDSRESCDYPDYARAVAEAVAAGRADRGILACGSGIGMAIAANKVKGIRAACCLDTVSAQLSRRDNDANVLTLGGRLIAPYLAKEIVRVWLQTPFAGGRHLRRLQKLPG